MCPRFVCNKCNKKYCTKKQFKQQQCENNLENMEKNGNELDLTKKISVEPDRNEHLHTVVIDVPEQIRLDIERTQQNLNLNVSVEDIRDIDLSTLFINV